MSDVPCPARCSLCNRDQGPSPLSDDLMLALGANVAAAVLNPETTSMDIVRKVLRALDASGYDVVKRDAAL